MTSLSKELNWSWDTSAETDEKIRIVNAICIVVGHRSSSQMPTHHSGNAEQTDEPFLFRVRMIKF